MIKNSKRVPNMAKNHQNGTKITFFDNYGTKKKNRFEEEVPSSSQFLENGWLKEKASFSKLDQRHKMRKKNAICGS